MAGCGCKGNQPPQPQNPQPVQTPVQPQQSNNTVQNAIKRTIQKYYSKA